MPAADRPDPISLLQTQNKRRTEKLLPIKYGCVLVSPFIFYRGTAVFITAALFHTPQTAIEVFLSGDAPSQTSVSLPHQNDAWYLI